MPQLLRNISQSLAGTTPAWRLSTHCKLTAAITPKTAAAGMQAQAGQLARQHYSASDAVVHDSSISPHHCSQPYNVSACEHDTH
jgi:hypothetical protein